MLFISITFFFVPNLHCQSVKNRPETPRIDYVVPLPEQPNEKSEVTIWYDDFNNKPKVYAEGESPLDEHESLGGTGKSMLCYYEKGSRGIGGRKVFFGDSPTYKNKTVRPTESFDEIYWRIYVKHQYGWIGAPAKMSRATSIVDEDWSQAMIAHVWSGTGASLTLDPVRAVKGKIVQTKGYNDFKNMTWLGNKPVSVFPIHSTRESGYWVMVESRVSLNTPGNSDGLNQLWIDGRLECERRDLNFRDYYTEHGINAVFLEAYWNNGSPATQSRWYDNFVISTKRIGPVVCPRNPEVIKTPYRGRDKSGGYEVEVSAGYNGENVVFRSDLLPEEELLIVDKKHGSFVGKLTDKSGLDSGTVYYLRIRQYNSAGVSSRWSRWHQGFKVK